MLLIITAFGDYGNFWTSATFEPEDNTWVWPSGIILSYNLVTPVGEEAYLYVDDPSGSTPGYKAGSNTLKMSSYCEASKSVRQQKSFKPSMPGNVQGRI